MIAKWAADNSYGCKFLAMESEHSVLSAAIASAAAGSRTFTATSSQGLLLMHEMLYVASGMRVPLVMVNVSRGLSAPITLWSDHNDVLDQRDAGWMIFFCENNQEVLDAVINFYKVSEDRRVLVPAMVNMDGFTLSYTREPLRLPAQSTVDRFLPPYMPAVRLDTAEPASLGAAVMEEYMHFRQQLHAAHGNALSIIGKNGRAWKRATGRGFGNIESFMMADAAAALVVMGSNSTIAKAAVKNLRSKGMKIGLVRIRTYRPFPAAELREALGGVGAVGVVDQNVAPGAGGIVYPEICAVLHGRDAIVSDFIVGLGGRSVSQQTFERIAAKTAKSGKPFTGWVL